MSVYAKYVPPARMRQMREQITNKESDEYQRLCWDALKKNLNGLINKSNTTNIKHILVDLFKQNLIRGRGLFCKSIMKAQLAAPRFTPIYAALVAVINSKFSKIGEMLSCRLIKAFKDAWTQDNKAVSVATTQFIAHLVNQRVLDDVVPLQMAILVLENVSEDGIEIAAGFIRECGQALMDQQPKALNILFDRFRTILHQCPNLAKRAQYMIEVLIYSRRAKFHQHPRIPEGLDLVEEEDQVTHLLSLEDDVDEVDYCNEYTFDENYLKSEAEYAQIQHEIFESDNEDIEEEAEVIVEQNSEIIDETGEELVNFRRKMYLLIMSSMSFEECVHKILKLDAKGMEMEIVKMIIDCCAQERTYKKFYGLMAERLCRIAGLWKNLFANAFKEVYSTIHRYETTHLRSVARLFSHLMSTDAISWDVFEVVVLTEESTTSASRVFLKILVLDIVENIGLSKLKERFSKPCPQFEGMFLKNHSINTRFSINYWTAIKLGALTEDLREHLLK